MKAQMKARKLNVYKILSITCTVATLFGVNAQAVTKKVDHQEQNSFKTRMHPADKQKIDKLLMNSSEYSYSSKNFTDANGNKPFNDMEEIQINFHFICDKKISTIHGNGGRVVNNCILKPIPSSVVTVNLIPSEATSSDRQQSKDPSENILGSNAQLKLKNYCQLDGVIKSNAALLTRDQLDLTDKFKNTIRSCAQETFELVKKIRIKNEKQSTVTAGKIYFEANNSDTIVNRFNKALNDIVVDMRKNEDESFYDMISNQDIGFQLACNSKESHFSRNCWFEVIDTQKFAKKNLTKPIDPHLLNENGFIDLNMKCHLNKDYAISKLTGDDFPNSINGSVIKSLKSCANTYFQNVHNLMLSSDEENNE